MVIPNKEGETERIAARSLSSLFLLFYLVCELKLYSKKSMKNMLIAGVAAGAVIAGLIWFFSTDVHPHEQINDGVIKSLDKQNADAPHLERGPHAMG